MNEFVAANHLKPWRNWPALAMTSFDAPDVRDYLPVRPSCSKDWLDYKVTTHVVGHQMFYILYDEPTQQMIITPYD
jgi:hypothetical protein